MVSSAARTVAAYLAELPPDRREVIATVREMVVAHLPAGYEERMAWGMIAWEVPLARYPDTYNGEPLMFAALAAQKNHYALYLTSVYGDKGLSDALEAAFTAAGLKLDMGKSCVRFKRLADLPLPAIGRVIAASPMDTFLQRYEQSRQAAPRASKARKTPKK